MGTALIDASAGGGAAVASRSRRAAGASAGAWAAAASRAWHAAIAAVVAACFAIQFALLAGEGSPDADGGSPAFATRLIRMLSYFTIQSNALVLIAAISLALRPGRDGRLWRVLRLDALLGIIITGLVFGLVLAKTVHPVGAARWATIGFHYVAPWAVLAGWLVFGPRPRIDRRTVAAAFLWPVLWVGYTLAHGAATGWYPYPFLDVARKGYGGALLSIGLIVLIALGLAAALAALDRLPAPRQPRRTRQEERASR